MSWLSSLFGGNSTVNNAGNSLLATGSSATNSGLGDLNTASQFYHSLLSGDTSSIAPQVNSIQKQGQQNLNTLSQFGNRSGGTNAAAQQSGDNTRASINDLIKSLTSSGAAGLSSIGSNLLSTGTSSTATGASILENNKSLLSNLLSTVGGGFGQAAGKKLFS